MNLALWIVQGLLAVGFLAIGMFKIVTPREKLMAKLRWAEGYSPAQIKQIGLAEVVGAIGLVVPWGTHIIPLLTPIAAICLTILMVGASVTHVSLKESPAPSALFGVLALFVAVGRFYPFHG
jgi:hypothetical protein